jgi:hypothetical protein
MCFLGFHTWRWACFRDELNGGTHIVMTCNRCGRTPAMQFIVTDDELPMRECRAW